MGARGREGKPQSSSEREAKNVAFYVGISCGIVIAAIFDSKWFFKNPFLRQHAVAAAVAGTAFLVVVAVFCTIRRFWYGVIMPIAGLPLVIGGAIERVTGHRTLAAGSLEAIGLVAVFSVAIGAALISARGVRELERRMYTEATSAAFFVTILATGIYGLAERFTHVPKLSVIWVPLFGALVWMVLGTIFGRRYS